MIRTLAILAPTVLAAAGCVGAGWTRPSYVPAPPRETEGAGAPAEVERLLALETLGAEDLVRIALLRNPELGAADARVGEAAGRRWQAALHPNPTLELESEDIPSDRISLGQGSNSVAVVHPVSLGGGRAREEEALEEERRAREAGRDRVARAVAREVRSLRAEILHRREALALADAALAEARGVLEIARTRLEARAATEADVARVRIEVGEMELERRALERSGPALEARLRAALGGADVPLDRVGGALAEDLPPVNPSLVGERLPSHPLLEEARREVAAADRRVERARAERLPDIDLRVAYGREPAARGNFVEAGIGIPLPLYDRGQGRVLEAEFAAARARRELRGAEGRLAADAAGALERYDTARESAEALRDRIVPDAARALAGTRDAYGAGRESLFGLLDALRTAARAGRALRDAVRDAHLARETLGEFLGTLPGEEETR